MLPERVIGNRSANWISNLKSEISNPIASIGDRALWKNDLLIRLGPDGCWGFDALWFNEWEKL